MSHKKAHPSDFSHDRGILNFRPNIDFVEPESVSEEAISAPAEAEPTIDELKLELNNNIDAYKEIEDLANSIQDEIDEKSKDLVIELDPDIDAHVIDAIRRHDMAQPSNKSNITYEDYKHCLMDMNGLSEANLNVIQQSDLDDASLDPNRTQFGGMGMRPGLARPELQKKAQAIKPIDLKKFAAKQLLELAVKLLLLMVGGPMKWLQRRLLKRIIKYLKKKQGKKFRKTGKPSFDVGNSKLTQEEIDDIAANPDDNEEEVEDPNNNDNPTQVQDCAVLTEAYEHGAHFTDTESSVFAPLSRQVQNSKTFAVNMQNVLKDYGSKVDTSLTHRHADTGSDAEANKSGLSFSNGIDIPVPDLGKLSNSSVGKALKECIPCKFRANAVLELKPLAALNAALKADIATRKNALLKLINLLRNFSVYDDICGTMGFFDFMCIPDLQRMLALLAALLQETGINLSGTMGMLMKLVGPFMTPILMSMMGLLDQLIQLVLEPIDCIIKSINREVDKFRIHPQTNTIIQKANVQLAKLSKEDKPFQLPTLQSTKLDALSRQKNQEAAAERASIEPAVRTALKQLGMFMDEGQLLLRSKLDFYMKQFQAMLGEIGIKDLGYTQYAERKLIQIRLLALISAIIHAKSKGNKVCQDYSDPAGEEIKRFHDDFLGSNSPYSVSVNPNGDLVITDRKATAGAGGQKVKEAPTDKKTLTQPPALLNAPTSKTIKCKFNTTSDDVTKVNKWLEELDRS